MFCCSRNAVVVLKQNLREIGRTHVVKGTIHPDWSATISANLLKNNMIKVCNRFDLHVGEDTLYTNCIIEIEVYDTDAKGNLTDYLGHLRFAGDSLKTLLETSRVADNTAGVAAKGLAFELLKSRKRNENENRHVKGSLEINAGMKELGKSNSGPTMFKKSMHGARRSSLMFLDKAQSSKRMAIIEESNDNEERRWDNLLENVFNLEDNEDLAEIRIRSEVYKSFYIYLLDLDLDIAEKAMFPQGYLPKDSQLVLIIHVNHMEQQRIVLTYQSQRHVHFGQEKCIEVRMPVSYPLALACVTFDLHVQRHKALSMKLASATLTGHYLKEFVHKGMVYYASLKKSSLAHDEAVKPPILSFFLYSLSNFLPLGKLKMISAIKKMEDNKYTVHIKSWCPLTNENLSG
jgi:hypothetical protein